MTLNCLLMVQLPLFIVFLGVFDRRFHAGFLDDFFHFLGLLFQWLLVLSLGVSLGDLAECYLLGSGLS